MTTAAANRSLQLFGRKIRPEGMIALVGLALVWQIVSYFTPPVLFPSVPQIAARTTRPPDVELTDRERDVLALIAEGRANKVIARRLGISEKTVKNHVTRILQALDVTDRTQAALWAQRHGIGPGA